MSNKLIVLLLAACAHSAPPPVPPATATIAGTVHFVGTPCESPAPGCDGPLANYTVAILAADGTTIVAKATTDATGHYTASVPAGSYAIMTEAGAGKPQPMKRNDVTVAAGATSTLDLTVDTGVR